MSDDPLEHLDRRLDRSSLIVTIAAVPLVFFLHSPKAALSVAVGAGLSWINFRWLKQAIDFVILKGAEGPVGKRVLARYAGRYALIGIILYATIRSSVLDVVFVLAGLFVYVLAILIECISEVGRVLIKDYRNGRT